MTITYKVPSETKSELTYEIIKADETCTCPAFVSGNTRPCKHLKHYFGLKGEDTLSDEPMELDLTKPIEIYTVGHSNHTIENFIQLLKKNGITLLVDVRSKPYSQYAPHFSKSALSQTIKNEGLKYIFGGKVLGGLNEISAFNVEFETKMKKILSLGQEATVAMMCSEGDPKKCHRAYKLSTWLLQNGVKVKHIMPKGGTIDGQELQDSLPVNWVDKSFHK